MIALPLGLLGIVVVVQQGRRPEAVSSRPPDAATVSRSRAVAGIDWNDVAAGLGEKHQGGRVDEASAYGRFLKAVHEMDGPALIAAWDALQAAGLANAEREQLETYLLGTLLRKDPAVALNRFAEHAGEPGSTIGAQLFGGFRDWATKSPVKAGLWMDANVAAGTFGTVQEPKGTGDMPVRVSYERELIRALLIGGPDQAAARLEAMPEEWRVMTLRGGDSPQGQAAYATLVRRFMTAEDQEREFIRMASTAAYLGGDSGVAELLDRIGATAEERGKIRRGTAGVPSDQ